MASLCAVAEAHLGVQEQRQATKDDEQHCSKRKDLIEDSPFGMIDLIRK